MLPNLRSAGRYVWTGARTCLVILDVWQWWHSLHHILTSFRIPFHTNFVDSIRVVGHAPGWLRQCTAWKICFRNASGTRGRNVPVEESHRRRTPFQATFSSLRLVS